MIVTIARYSFPHEAHLDKANLENAGILAYIFDEHTVGMNWLYSNAIGGVRLLVANEDVAEAMKILSTDYSHELEDIYDE